MIEAIADRVTASLRKELEAIVEELAAPNGSGPSLTVEEVAERFGIARSTVYAHWREWGGYKIGRSDRAPIRFDIARLSATPPGSPLTTTPSGSDGAPERSRPKRRKRRELETDEPRFDQPLTDIG